MTPDLPSSLPRKRAAARAALWWERLWPAFWPALGTLGAYVALALLNLPALLPPWPRAVLPVLVLVLVAGLLWRGLHRIAAPTPDAADRRLETATGLRHRPLATLQDSPASPTPEAQAVWRIHQSRVLAQVQRLRVGMARPGLARHDTRALRGLVVVALAAGFVVAGPDAPRRLWAAIVPGLPAPPPVPGTVVQAWLTPPAYTSLPPVFLHSGQPAPPIPVGAHLTASVTGGANLANDPPTLAYGSEDTRFDALDATSWQAARDLPGDGRLAVRRNGQDLAAWTITTIPDRPPNAAFVDPPGPALSGGRPTTQTRFAWTADDDYGVVSAQIQLRLQDRPGAAALLIPAPLGGTPKDARGTVVQDLTAHPWAGLAATARVVAKDAPGQLGSSPDVPLTLPERPFRNPAAQAVIAIRKQLTLTPDARDDARIALDALADHPDLFNNALGIVLNLRALGSLLARVPGQAAVDEAQARMWELALALEEGASDRTANALAEARQAMRDAMESARQDPENAEKRAELEQRMQELRDAIQKHMEALAEQARREGSEMPFDPSQPQMNSRELDRMAQRMEDAAREGRMDDAKQQMAELEKLLEQLQNARPEHGEQREQRNAERRQQGRQQQDAVQDMVRREGDLLDRSRSRADEPGRGPQPGSQTNLQPSPQANRPSPQPGQQPPRDQDTKRQTAMRRALGELMQRFGDLTGDVPAPLGEADIAMRDAAAASQAGQDAAAARSQQKAIEALQKGGRAMGQQVARQFGRGHDPGQGEDGQGEEGQGDEGQDGSGTQMGSGDDPKGGPGQTVGPQPGDERGPGRRRSARRDPLGRPLGEGIGGTSDSGDVRVPDQMEEARTRALQDELRRRGAERTRPQNELDYIDRLLKSY